MELTQRTGVKHQYDPDCKRYASQYVEEPHIYVEQCGYGVDQKEQENRYDEQVVPNFRWAVEP